MIRLAVFETSLSAFIANTPLVALLVPVVATPALTLGRPSGIERGSSEWTRAEVARDEKRYFQVGLLPTSR